VRRGARARAELLARAGQATAAAALLDRFPPQSRRTGLPMSRWLLARARVAAHAGDVAAAAGFRRDLAALWRRADAPLLAAVTADEPHPN
jgi:hypothetical protein